MKAKTVLWGLFFSSMTGATAAAQGIPTMQPLTYTGILQNAGQPVTNEQTVQVTLWDDEAANAAMNQRCITPAQSVTPDAQGRFHVLLDQTCFEAVRTNPNLWIQVQVGGSLLPRSKVGAVPYAVESGRSGRVILEHNGKATSAFGLYCGATASATNGGITFNALTGRRAAKALCEQACNSRTAHMCSTAEASTSMTLDLPLVTGWASASVAVADPSNGVSHDCNGWTTGAHGAGPFNVGHFWEQSGEIVGAAFCDSMRPVICCD